MRRAILVPRTLALAFLCACSAVFVLGGPAFAAITGHQLVIDKSGPGDYSATAVGDRYAVIQKWNSSDMDLVAFDLEQSTPSEVILANTSVDEIEPAVWGNTCVYVRKDVGGKYDLRTSTIPPSTVGGRPPDPSWDYREPSIWGDDVVFALDDDQDGRYDIAHWNMKETGLHPVYEASSLASGRNPQIWRETVVWQRQLATKTDVSYRWDLEGSGSTAPLAPQYNGDRVLPSVWGEWIVWEDHTSADNDIVAYNVLSRRTTEIGHDGFIDGNPSVFDDRVTYTSLANDLSSAHVYAYDLSRGMEHELWQGSGILGFGESSAFGTDVGWWDFALGSDAHVTRVQASLDVEQLEGATRYETAVEISKEMCPGTSESVIVATGQNFPDALGGSALAGALDCPILLTRPTVLPESVKTELKRLMPKDVYILGGAGAVEDEVEVAIESALPQATVARLEGADRYGTARAVAEEAFSHPRIEFQGKAFVATGANFPDALAVSPVATALQMPIYLAEPSGISAASISHMESMNVEDVYIVGGADVVSALTEERLTDAFGTDHVHRIAGQTRYETAAEIAEWAVEEMPWIEYCGVTLATGQNFPDALAGGALAGSRGTVMLLTHTSALTPSTRAVLEGECVGTPRVTFFGGDGAIQPEVIGAVQGALQ